MRFTTEAWRDRLVRLYPKMAFDGLSREEMEALVCNDKGISPAEAYRLHPEFYEVIKDQTHLLDGFADASGDFMLWSLALAAYWGDHAPSAAKGFRASVLFALCALLETGCRPVQVGFQRELKDMGASEWCVRRGASFEAAYRPGTDLLEFARYACGLDPFTARRAMEQGIPREYASAF